ncbi:magnesium citrate secondary transporter [Cyclobacterium qasimii]|uniref:magnesium citrate secondary transporter n=1 Tax=Cyclobacterium qasimii TaxID=1350429 RepID=UPI001FCF982B|nr:magnesium citrate secondary transporter [Cyclobacterium qasimii]
MAIPVVLGITLQAFRWMNGENTQMVFSKKQVIIGVVYFGFLFEGLLPFWSSTYVRDPFDLLCYAVGAVYFWVFINNKGIKKIN